MVQAALSTSIDAVAREERKEQAQREPNIIGNAEGPATERMQPFDFNAYMLPNMQNQREPNAQLTLDQFSRKVSSK